jgi:hypothetical protein
MRIRQSYQHAHSNMLNDFSKKMGANCWDTMAVVMPLFRP